MDTETQTPSGEQPDVNVETAAGEQPARNRDTDSSPLDNFSSEQLMAALEEDEIEAPESVQAPEPEAKEEETNEEEETTAEETPTSQTESEEETETEEQPEATKTTNKHDPLRRVPLGGIPKEQRELIANATELIRSGQAKDLAEAVAKLGGTLPAASEETPSDEPETSPTSRETTTEAPSSVQAIKDRIAELREQRDAAKDVFEELEVRRLTNEIEDAHVDLIRAERAEERRLESQRSWDAMHDAACDKVEAKYPEAGDPTSRFSRNLENARIAFEAKNDMAKADPSFIEALADQVAEDLGYKKQAPEAPKAKPNKPKGDQLAPGHGSAQRVSRTDAQRMIQEMDPEKLKELVCTE